MAPAGAICDDRVVEAREMRRLGFAAGAVGLGTWQLGADWGSVDPDEARATLDAALDAGVNFFDTADVYGDGRSERFCGELRSRHPGASVLIATKMGRRVEQLASNYNGKAFLDWNDRSRENLGTEEIDLVQLHCPPSEVIADDAVFEALEEMVSAGRMRAYGVSVETCAQAPDAIARPNVATIQIILNCFRMKPLEEVLPAALEAGVGVIARVPLASGLLSGRYDEHTTFGEDDHRNFNRHGEEFDVGETFSGVPFDVGLAAARELREVAGPDVPLAQFAIRWVIDQPGVSVVIPGARNPEQARQNAAAADLPPLTDEKLAGVASVYDRLIRPHVHDRW
jgi:aryl-alcohol dehydrogenase-like predicted oxidoreductase